jgi:hypothetical protein
MKETSIFRKSQNPVTNWKMQKSFTENLLGSDKRLILGIVPQKLGVYTLPCKQACGVFAQKYLKYFALLGQQ